MRHIRTCTLPAKADLCDDLRGIDERLAELAGCAPDKKQTLKDASGV